MFNEHADVLLIGDSIMNQSGTFVKAHLRTQRGLEDSSTHVSAVNGSGLMTPALYDWQTEARSLAEKHSPLITVVLFVGNYTDTDLFIGADGAEIPNDYSQVFFDEWGRQAERLTKTLQATGTQVSWVLPLPIFSDEGLRRETLMRQTYLDLAQRMPGVGLIDGRQALGDATGAFVWQLPGPDGQLVTVRAGDSLHLTEAGGDRMARQIALGIGPQLLEIKRQNAAS